MLGGEYHRKSPWRMRWAVLIGAGLLLSSCSRFLETELYQGGRGDRLTEEFAAVYNRQDGAKVFSRPIYDDPRSAPDSAENRGKRRSRIFSGSGVAGSMTRSDVQAEVKSGDVSLDFDDADVAQAARLILGDILKRNFVLSPKVKGKLTFETTRPLTRSAVLDAFDTVLSTIDATLVDRGDIIEIVPLKEARGAAAPLATPGKGRPGFRVEIVPLRFVDAEQVRQIVEPIGGAGSILSVDKARNVLILAGSARTIAPLKETIALFDQNWAAKSSLGLVPLENVSAETAVKEMRAIFGSRGQKPNLAVRYVPIARMNAVVLIAPDRGLVREMIIWLEELDDRSLSSEDRVYVYFAQNTKAVDLAVSIQSVLTGRTSRSEPDIADAVRSSARSSSQGDAGRASERSADAARFTSGAGSGVAFAGVDASRVQIVPEEQRNALLVSASPSDWRKVEAILRRLDVPPLQVLLEATVIEVTLNDTLRYGLQWFFNEGNHELTLSDVASGAVNPAFPGFSYVFSTDDVRGALDALTEVTDLEVVSAPSLMVLNNETATLQVGEQVPIAVQSAISVEDADAPIVNSLQYRDTGVILKVKPRVNNSGLVIAEIEQEVSTVSSTSSSNIDSPTISQRRISSTIAVADGEAIALGGLIQERRNLGKSGVPLLSDVPLLGALFRSSSNQAQRTELLLIITPRVVRDASEARAVTAELRERLRRNRADR